MQEQKVINNSGRLLCYATREKQGKIQRLEQLKDNSSLAGKGSSCGSSTPINSSMFLRCSYIFRSPVVAASSSATKSWATAKEHKIFTSRTK
jgi:hypothetical protein